MTWRTFFCIACNMTWRVMNLFPRWMNDHSKLRQRNAGVVVFPMNRGMSRRNAVSCEEGLAAIWEES
jgi:hypothetical protein